MAASNATVKAIYDIIAEFVPNVVARGELIDRLCLVPGNQSFTVTCRMIRTEHQLHEGKRT